MKALITYFSQTGNTKKIADAISESISKNVETVSQLLENADVQSIAEYDIVFIGSPCHAGDLSAPVKKFLGSIPDNSNCKVAGFVTHAGAVYSKADYEQSFETFKTICSEKGIKVLGIYDCQGFLNPKIHDFVKNRKNLSDEEWEKRVESMKGHPDNDDLERAKVFARDMIEKL